MKDVVETRVWKMIEDDEMRGPGRRPAPIVYEILKNGCWRVVNRGMNGYGKNAHPVMMYGGKQIPVSRFFWRMMGNGPIGPEMKLYSKCGNAWCVNPEHREKMEMPDVLS